MTRPRFFLPVESPRQPTGTRAMIPIKHVRQAAKKHLRSGRRHPRCCYPIRIRTAVNHTPAPINDNGRVLTLPSESGFYLPATAVNGSRFTSEKFTPPDAAERWRQLLHKKGASAAAPGFSCSLYFLSASITLLRIRWGEGGRRPDEICLITSPSMSRYCPDDPTPSPSPSIPIWPRHPPSPRISTTRWPRQTWPPLLHRHVCAVLDGHRHARHRKVVLRRDQNRVANMLVVLRQVNGRHHRCDHPVFHRFGQWRGMIRLGLGRIAAFTVASARTPLAHWEASPETLPLCHLCRRVWLVDLTTVSPRRCPVPPVP